MKKIHSRVLISLITLATLFSCKKDISNSLENDNELIKKETATWYSTVKPTISGSVLNSISKKIENIDFDNSIKIDNPKLKTEIFVLKIKESDGKNDEYLAFSKQNNLFTTIGKLVVAQSNAANEILNIKNFFLNSKLKKDFELNIYRLNNRHHVTLEGTDNFGIKAKTIKSNKTNTSNTSTSTLNAVENSIDWYMITTYTNSDGFQYQTETYLTSTCGGGSGCELSDPQGQQLECINPCEGGGGNGSG
jgi:hypothetical protein